MGPHIFPEPQGLLLTASMAGSHPDPSLSAGTLFSLSLDLFPEEPGKKPWADSQEALSWSLPPEWSGCLESLESKGGDLILSLSLAKPMRVTNTEPWLPDPRGAGQGMSALQRRLRPWEMT